MKYLIIFFLIIVQDFYSQTLPSNRAFDWSIVGLRDTSTTNFQLIDMNILGVIGDNITPNDSIVNYAINSAPTSGAILMFPKGHFLFNTTLNLRDNIVLKGLGADSTTFTFDLGGLGHSIRISGNSTNDTSNFVADGLKDSNYVDVNNASLFSSGDWIRIVQNDSDIVTSSWALGTVGQIVKIVSVNNNRINLKSPLRRDYSLSRIPYIKKINPMNNVGIECIKIHRLDSTSPQQSSNIYFNYVVNSWVLGVESENCSYSHVDARNSSNLYINKSYFHHAFGYGGGGRAYGVMLHSTTNECLVEDNIFEHLRHSMIVQSGGNGNVFSYNYSLDPFWNSTPNNSAGDMVLHGNFPYSNLFEQNVCRNIVVDNSHGPNGDHNTFFRNRAEGFGIFFSANNSPNQNFIGNDIPNTSFPYSLVNYTISGSGHFLYGNNNKGVIDPSGTNNLPDLSYTYIQKPNFISMNQWAGIGTPNSMGVNHIPAMDRFNSSVTPNAACGEFISSVKSPERYKIETYPNPISNKINIRSEKAITSVVVYNLLGKVITSYYFNERHVVIDFSNYIKGIYILHVFSENQKAITHKLIKN